MALKVEPITDSLELGEGPHWDDAQQALFFVDIYQSTIHKYVPATKTHTRTKLDGGPGFIVPVEGTVDQFVVGLENKFVVVQWDGGEGTPARVVRQLGAVDQDIEPPTRINDGKADPKGRVFAGTIGHHNADGSFDADQCSLYRVDASGIHKVEGGITVSNGLSWDLQRKAFYYTDTLEKKIRRYDYDVETGEISNLKYIFDFEKNDVEGLPDGHTIDTDGNLWVAAFNGSSVIKIDPNSGKLLQKVPMPVRQVTSVTFGGENLDILFVTSGRIKNTFEETPKPPNGTTYMVTGLGAKGTKGFNFKLE